MTNTYSIRRQGVEVYRYDCDGGPLTFDEFASSDFVQELVPPVPMLVYDGRRRLSKYEYLSLFTPAERVAIRASTDPIIMDFREMVNVALEVNLDLDITQQALGYLAAQGLLEPARVAEILRG